MKNLDKLIGAYEEQPYSISRKVGVDFVSIGKTRHHIPILFEVDVSTARSAIQNRKEVTGEGVSFTGWVIKCLAQAASEHKRVHAIRQGRSKLIIFDDVDISIAVQRQVTGSELPQTLPMPYVIRKTNEKSLEQIHAEIRAAQVQPLAEGEQTITEERTAYPPWMLHIFFALPRFIRNIFWDRLVNDPFYAKKTMGTVVVTSVGMFGKVGIGNSWGISTGLHPLVVVIGGIARKPGVIDDRIEIREILSMTVLFDHDVIDGAPVAIFLQRLRDLMESGYGL